MCFYVISNVCEKSLPLCYKISPLVEVAKTPNDNDLQNTKIPLLSFSGNQVILYIYSYYIN